MVLFDCFAHLAYHLDTNLAEHDTPHGYRWGRLWCPGYRGGIWTRNVKDFLLHPELEAESKREAIMVEDGDYEPDIPSESPTTEYCNDELKV
jgi:hypothetical protein